MKTHRDWPRICRSICTTWWTQPILRSLQVNKEFNKENQFRLEPS